MTEERCQFFTRDAAAKWIAEEKEKTFDAERVIKF